MADPAVAATVAAAKAVIKNNLAEGSGRDRPGI